MEMTFEHKYKNNSIENGYQSINKCKIKIQRYQCGKYYL